MPLLRARGLTKEFTTTDSPTRVLNGIDLDVDAGEFLAVMGASGAGKSTLLYTLSAMDRPTSGSASTPSWGGSASRPSPITASPRRREASSSAPPCAGLWSPTR